MLAPQQLLRLFIELIFILLGMLSIWLGLSGQIFFDRRKPAWFILSAALLLWGLRVLYKPGQRASRWEHWIRGISLIAIGAVMFAISRAPFLWIGKLVALAGVVLVLRGLVASFLILRPRSG